MVTQSFSFNAALFVAVNFDEVFLADVSCVKSPIFLDTEFHFRRLYKIKFVFLGKGFPQDSCPSKIDFRAFLIDWIEIL